MAVLSDSEETANLRAGGKNGGHCQPFVYLSQPHIGRFELATYDFLGDLIRQNDIPCSWEEVGGVHSITSPSMASLVEERMSQLRASHPDLARRVRLVTDREELRALRLRDEHAVAAVVQDHAAKCWPYKLVCWVLERLLDQPGGGFNLQTGTPVEHVQRHEGGWIVHTERGQVAARHVVLATNAYTSHLLPRLAGLINPVRAQVCALTPPGGAVPLEHTHVWPVLEDGDPGESDDYLVQRPTGELIMGGERMAVADGGEGVWRDDEVDPVVGRRLRRALPRALRLGGGGGGEEQGRELEASYEWTGIMGYSRDAMPWVGRVPESLGGSDGGDGDGGLWVSAGYTGHGMPVAARCGIAVAEMITGKTEGAVEVPPEWEISEARMEAASAFVLPLTVEDEMRALLGLT